MADTQPTFKSIHSVLSAAQYMESQLTGAGYDFINLKNLDGRALIGVLETGENGKTVTPLNVILNRLERERLTTSTEAEIDLDEKFGEDFRKLLTESTFLVFDPAKEDNSYTALSFGADGNIKPSEVKEGELATNQGRNPASRERLLAEAATDEKKHLLERAQISGMMQSLTFADKVRMRFGGTNARIKSHQQYTTQGQEQYDKILQDGEKRTRQAQENEQERQRKINAAQQEQQAAQAKPPEEKQQEPAKKQPENNLRKQNRFPQQTVPREYQVRTIVAKEPVPFDKIRTPSEAFAHMQAELRGQRFGHTDLSLPENHALIGVVENGKDGKRIIPLHTAIRNLVRKQQEEERETERPSNYFASNITKLLRSSTFVVFDPAKGDNDFTALSMGADGKIGPGEVSKNEFQNVNGLPAFSRGRLQEVTAKDVANEIVTVQKRSIKFEPLTSTERMQKNAGVTNLRIEKDNYFTTREHGLYNSVMKDGTARFSKAQERAKIQLEEEQRATVLKAAKEENETGNIKKMPEGKAQEVEKVQKQTEDTIKNTGNDPVVVTDPQKKGPAKPQKTTDVFHEIKQEQAAANALKAFIAKGVVPETIEMNGKTVNVPKLVEALESGIERISKVTEPTKTKLADKVVEHQLEKTSGL